MAKKINPTLPENIKEQFNQFIRDITVENNVEADRIKLDGYIIQPMIMPDRKLVLCLTKASDMDGTDYFNIEWSANGDMIVKLITPERVLEATFESLKF